MILAHALVCLPLGSLPPGQEPAGAMIEEAATMTPATNLPATREALHFPAGTDLSTVLSAYARGCELLWHTTAPDAVRSTVLRADLTWSPDEAAAGVEALCRETQLALWVEAHGPWGVLKSQPLAELGIGDARFVPAESLDLLPDRPALPVTTVLPIGSLVEAARARNFPDADGLHLIRPGDGRVGWNGLVLWGFAPEVRAAAAAYAGTTTADPVEPVEREPLLRAIERRPTFGVEDHIHHLRRDDGVLAGTLTLVDGGAFLVEGNLVSLEELLRAYELATWRSVEFLGGCLQSARQLAAPAFPRRRLTQAELDHWIQAVLASHGWVGQPRTRSGLFVRPLGRYGSATDFLEGPVDPAELAQAISAGAARFVLVPDEVARAVDLLDRTEHALVGLTFGRCERRDWGEGYYLLGPEVRVRQAYAALSALDEATRRGPAVLVVRVDGDAAALARRVSTSLHPDRNPEELAMLPWFGQPLVGASNGEVLIVAHPDRVALLANEVKGLR